MKMKLNTIMSIKFLFSITVFYFVVNVECGKFSEKYCPKNDIDQFCANTTDLSCKASSGLFTGIKIRIRNCEFPYSLDLVPGLVTEKHVSKVDFYHRFRRSKWTLSLSISGTYEGYTFPPAAQAVLTYYFFIPIKDISNPFDNRFKTCSLTVPSYNSKKAACVCTVIKNGVFCYDCTGVKLVDKTPDTDDVYYPSNTCG